MSDDVRIETAAAYISGKDLTLVRCLEADTAFYSNVKARQGELEQIWLEVLARATGPEGRRLACQQLALVGGDAALAPLAVLLGQEEHVDIPLIALAGIPGVGPLQVLKSSLPVMEKAQRVQILDSLRRRGDPRAVDAIAMWCRHPDLTVAAAAIRAIGRLSESARIDVLEAALRDDREAIRQEAVAALTEVAQRALQRGNLRDARHRLEGVLAMAPSYGRRGAFELLMQCDADGGAARALSLLSARPLDHILAPVAIAAIPRFSGRDVSARVGALWTNLPIHLHAAVAEALARRALEQGDERSRLVLSRAMWWEPVSVRTAAIQAVGRCGGPSEVRALFGNGGDRAAPQSRLQGFARS